MKYKVVLSRKANQMIKNHLPFISNVSIEAAHKQANEFKGAIKRIAADPGMYPFFEEEYIPHGKYHKCLISRRYMLIYQIKDHTVYIDYILDVRNDYSWLLR